MSMKRCNKLKLKLKTILKWFVTYLVKQTVGRTYAHNKLKITSRHTRSITQTSRVFLIIIPMAMVHFIFFGEDIALTFSKESKGGDRQATQLSSGTPTRLQSLDFSVQGQKSYDRSASQWASIYFWARTQDEMALFEWSHENPWIKILSYKILARFTTSGWRCDLLWKTKGVSPHGKASGRTLPCCDKGRGINFQHA